jgi:outer membrane protein assembly factor BamA
LQANAAELELDSQAWRSASIGVLMVSLSRATATAFVMLLATLISTGCASLPRGRAAVDSVELSGNRELSGRSIKKKIATRASSKFLGLFQGVVYDYEVFDLYVLQRDLARVERYYRARGFYKARARAGRVTYESPQHVRVVIEVEEGPETLVSRLDLFGLDGLDADLASAARAAAEQRVGKGERFDEEEFEAAEQAIRRVLTDAGHAYARVSRVAEVDLPRDSARVRFDVVPGPPARFGAITITGLGDLPEHKVRNALLIEEGDPYSTSEIEEAQQAVLDLGVFSSVAIEPKLTDPPPRSRRVPIVVEVQRSKLHAAKLGAGIQLDAIRSDFHLVTGWEHKNLFGGLRRFTVEFRPGVVFYPTRVPSFESPTHFLPEEKLRAELRQPGIFEGRTNGFVRGEFNIYPVLLSPEVDPDAPIIGYREAKGTLGIDRKFWRFYASPTYNAQQNTPFAYAGSLDDALSAVLISYGALFLSFDLRDDQISPHSGVFLSNELQAAGGPLGGDASDFKLQPEARFYVPVSDDLTLALRSTVGLLFPRNYGHTLESNARAERPPPGVDRAGWARDVQVTFFRAFFAGGPTSNRGYPWRGIGPHGVIPFFEPALAAEQLAESCQPGSDGFAQARCELPLGGLTLWEASVELRYPIVGPLSGSAFCDSSDVSPRRVSFRFDRPHVSCGLGGRYDTPVGPVRLDAGYRIPGMQVLGPDDGEGTPPTLFGAPIAIHVGIGEAF